MKKQGGYSIQEAQAVLERYCSYQERSHKEVAEKLQKMGMIPEAQEGIILHLLQHNFLNEERFAKAFAGGKFRIKKWGKLKITQALVQKGVSTANIKTGLDEIDTQDYIRTLKELTKKYLGFTTFNSDKNDEEWLLAIKKLSYPEKQKLIRHLYQKGFETGLIYEYIIKGEI